MWQVKKHVRVAGPFGYRTVVFAGDETRREEPLDQSNIYSTGTLQSYTAESSSCSSDRYLYYIYPANQIV